MAIGIGLHCWYCERGPCNGECELKEKRYTKEDMKNFGLWLGKNLKKNKGKSIDDLFNQFLKQ